MTKSNAATAYAFFATILYIDKHGNERDQPSIAVATTSADAARCLYEEWSSNPDCASIIAIAVDREAIPVNDADDLADAPADAMARATNGRPAGQTLH